MHKVHMAALNPAPILASTDVLESALARFAALFTAAADTGADVLLFERHAPLAPDALRAWALANGLSYETVRYPASSQGPALTVLRVHPRGPVRNHSSIDIHLDGGAS